VDDEHSGIHLYWLPLGAGGHLLRLAGFAFEEIAARSASRPRLDLYHAALELRTSEARFVIEVMPSIWGATARKCQGVVAGGPVGSPLARRFRALRYDLRCWRDGLIVDVEHAVASPVQISDDPLAARRLLDLVSHVPMTTWGRDKLGAGEMWTSNSVIAWLLARANAGSADLHPPPGGRAPGWDAGLRVAARDESTSLQPWVSSPVTELLPRAGVAAVEGGYAGQRSA
jgi:hypothetical protein